MTLPAPRYVATPLNVLIACEESGAMRDAFRLLGHNAWSNDLKPGRGHFHEYHLRGDAIAAASYRFYACENTRHPVLPDGGRWDLLIGHPDCTYLTCSAEWAYGDGPYHQRVKPGTLVGAAPSRARIEAFEFFMALWNAGNIPRRAFENPAVGAMSRLWRPPDQCVQPYQFGDDASKNTGWWLLDLPPLVLDPAARVPGRIVGYDKRGRAIERWANQTDSGQNRLSPGDGRAAERSVTYPGIAMAAALQWGGIVIS